MYLVTGGAGFIGSHLVEALLAQGHRVRVADDLSSGFAKNLERVRDRIEFHQVDIADPERALEMSSDCAGVFHLAAMVSVAESVEKPLESHRRTATSTLAVLQAARVKGVKRVVIASTAAAYGNNPELPKRENMTPEPASPYAAAKVVSEYYARIYHQLYGLETLCLRFFNVYGPRQDPSSPYSGVISRFIDALRRGEPLTIFGDGRQTRDFVNVRDVVAALLAAMFRAGQADGSVVNVATGRETDLLTLAGVLQKITGISLEIRHKEPRPGDVRRSVADVTRARDRLGFEASVSLENGLRELWEASI